MRTGFHGRRWSHRRGAALVLGAGVMVGSLVGSPATAAPAARYASPSGSGSACTQANPCDLGTAITGAAKGARILVRGDQGDYLRSAGITATKAVRLVGIKGRPHIVFSAGGLKLANGGTATNLQVEAYGDDAAFQLDGGADASRIFAKAGGTSHACTVMGGSNLTNVVCWAAGAADKALEAKGTTKLRNVTAYGGTEAALRIVGYDICNCDQFTVSLVNTILWAPASTDLSITTDLPDVVVKPTYSNYRTVDSVEEGADIRVVKSTTNQTKAGQRPKFIDASGGNLRAATKSPVINKGVNAKANGRKDLDGRPRKVARRTDIGAYEYSPPNTTITAGPTGTVSGSPAAFTFKASRASATFQCRIDSSPLWQVCVTPYNAGWSNGSHAFRVRAVDGLGYVDPSPARRSFTVTGG